MNTPEVTLLYPETSMYDVYHKTPILRQSTQNHRVQNPISIGLATPRLFRSNRNFSFFEQHQPASSRNITKSHNNRLNNQHNFAKHISFDEDSTTSNKMMLDIKRTSELCLDHLGSNTTSNHQFQNANQSFNYTPVGNSGVEKKRKILQFFSKMRRTKSSSKLNQEQRGFCWNESIADMEHLTSTPSGTLHDRLDDIQTSIDEENNTNEPLEILYNHLNLSNKSASGQKIQKLNKVFPVIRELHPSILSNRQLSFQHGHTNESFFIISNQQQIDDESMEEQQVQGQVNKIYSCPDNDLDPWISGLSQFLNSDHYRSTRQINRIVVWIQEIKNLPKNKQYYCTLSIDSILIAQTPLKMATDLLLFNEEIRVPVVGNHKTLRLDVWTVKSDRMKDFHDRSSSILTFNQTEISRQSRAFSDVTTTTELSDKDPSNNNNSNGKSMVNKRFSVPSTKDFSDELNENEKIITCSSKISRKKKKSKKGNRKYSDEYFPMHCGFYETSLDQFGNNGDEHEDWYNLNSSMDFQTECSNSTQTRKSFSLMNQSSCSSPTLPQQLQIRFRIKQRSLRVMTLQVYQDLLDFTNPSVNLDFLSTLLNLEGVMSLREKTEFASLILDIHKGSVNFKAILSELIINNIDNTSEKSLILRGNSLASKAMEIYVKQTAMNYLKMTLGDIFTVLFEKSTNESPTGGKQRQRSSSQSQDNSSRRMPNDQMQTQSFSGFQELKKLRFDCEIDSTRLTTTNGQKNLDLILAKNRQNLLNVCQIIWQRIYNSHHYFPKELQEVFAEIRCRLCLSRLNRRPSRYPNEVNNNPPSQPEDPEILALNAISSCLFLRFLCPAILNPYLFGLVDRVPENLNLIRTLTLVAKTIQSLANLCLLNSSKEEYMNCMNSFVSSKMNQMKSFLRIVSTNTNTKDHHHISSMNNHKNAKSISEDSQYEQSLQGKSRVVSSRSMHTGLQEFVGDDGNIPGEGYNYSHDNGISHTSHKNGLMASSVIAFNEAPHSRMNNNKFTESMPRKVESDDLRNQVLRNVDFRACPVICLPQCPKAYRVYSNAKALALATCHSLLSNLFKNNPKIRMNQKFTKLCKVLEQIDFLRDNPEEMAGYLVKSRIFSIKEDFPLANGLSSKQNPVDFICHSRPMPDQEIVGESIYDLPLVNPTDYGIQSELEAKLIGETLDGNSCEQFTTNPPWVHRTNYGVLSVQNPRRIVSPCDQNQKSFINFENATKNSLSHGSGSNFDSLSTSGYHSTSNGIGANPFLAYNTSNKSSIDSPSNTASTRSHSREVLFDYDNMHKSQVLPSSMNSPSENNYFFPSDPSAFDHEKVVDVSQKSQKNPPPSTKIHSYLSNVNHMQNSQYSTMTSYNPYNNSCENSINNGSSTSAGTLHKNQSILSSNSSNSTGVVVIADKRPSTNGTSSSIQTSMIDLHEDSALSENEKFEAIESSRRLALTRIRLLANEQEHRELMKTLREELKRHDNYSTKTQQPSMNLINR